MAKRVSARRQEHCAAGGSGVCTRLLRFSCRASVRNGRDVNDRKYPFLPLMTISLSCAVGNCYVFYKSVRQMQKIKEDYAVCYKHANAQARHGLNHYQNCQNDQIFGS